MSTLIDNDQFGGTHVEASPWPTAIRWGVISAVIGIVLQLLMFVTGVSDPTTLAGSPLLAVLIGGVALLVGVAVQYLGTKAYKENDNHGWLTLGQAVKWALFYGLIVGVITLVWTLIYTGFIAGDQMAEMQQAQMNELEEGGASEEELEMMRTVTGAVSSPWLQAVLALFGSVIFSIIVGLVFGLIMRTTGPRSTYA